MSDLSPNTQAVLLLTAPLIVGPRTQKAQRLSPGEYKRLAIRLHETNYEPADLVNAKSEDCLQACKGLIETDRLKRLLGRGFQLSQAVEAWKARAIWVVGRGDSHYPQRLKARLRARAPAILYGCGEIDLLERGGLAVVGSRHVEEALIDYTQNIGRLTANSARVIVSGGAKGIDQAAMTGALDAGGQVCGVLADSLERQVMNREHRNKILDEQLLLVSPYDPNVGFNVGQAMQRNKLIYALADASLVVSSDRGKGGTWTGAVEQLEKLKFVPVYVRSTGQPSPGLDGLRDKGALDWPTPKNAEQLQDLLDAAERLPSQFDPSLFGDQEPAPAIDSQAPPPAQQRAPKREPCSDTLVPQTPTSPPDNLQQDNQTPGEALFLAARTAIEDLLADPMKDSEIADALDITNAQAKAWLNRLVEQGIIEKKKRPVTYVIKTKRLFD